MGDATTLPKLQPRHRERKVHGLLLQHPVVEFYEERYDENGSLYERRLLEPVRKWRNAAMYEARREGKSFSWIGFHFAITSRRAEQIVKAEHGRRLRWWRRGGSQHFVRGYPLFEQDEGGN